MLHPFLFIGVGGSGGKTLRTLHHDLSQRLLEAGYTGAWPTCWQFLHIDVPTVPDGNEQDLPSQLEERDYVGLVGRHITYPTIDHALTSSVKSEEGLIRGLLGWRPEPTLVNVPVTKGAGQYRVLGRVITVTHLNTVAEAMRRSLQALHGAQMTADLAAVSRAFGVDVADNPPGPEAVIVSSLAGGSGSGAFLDVCDALRATGGGGWTDESFAVLFAPDVFDHLDPESRKGVHANALAALCELMNGFWDREPRAEEFALMEGRGIAAGAPQRRGPRFPLIVGTRNETVGFTHQNDVYRAMGKALAAWTCSEHLQTVIKAHATGNWPLSSLLPDRTRLRAPEQEEPLCGIGFGRVSLGRDSFAEYAAQRLARRAVERVMRQHLADRPIDSDVNAEVAIDEIVTATFHPFLEESGLNERTEEHNQILDSLRPLDRSDRLAEATDAIKGIVTSGRSKAVPARQWLAEAIEVLKDQQQTFADEEAARRNERARDWAKVIQDRLVHLVARSVATYGAPVTEKLLDRLHAELDYVLTELPDEEGKYRHWADQLDQLVSAVLKPVNDALAADNPVIAQAINKGVDCYDYLAEAELRRFAVTLIEDLATNLVEPLQQAVRSGREVLSVRSQSTSSQPSVVDMWPTGDLVPRRFAPAGNEFLLESVDDYPSIFKSLVVRSSSVDDPGGAEAEFVRHAILGSRPLDRDAQSLVRTQTAWIPGVQELHTSFGASARGQFELVLEPAEVLDRARWLVEDRETPLGEFVGESLQDYLDERKVEVAELNRRIDRFRDAFLQALQTSAPLVNIDPQVMTRVHEMNAPGVSYMFTEIPFPQGTKGYDTVRKVLESRGQWDESLEGAFSEGRQARIDVFSMLASAYNPVVFESIVRPIAAEWGRRRLSADGRGGFWRWRRARPLTSFVPVSPDVRLAMVRGWFTARLLGEILYDLSDREVMQIWDPSTQRALPFPHPLLGPAVFEEWERLPAVLESLPLALIEFAERSTEGDQALAPYWRLRELGGDARGGEKVYERLNPTLESWILRGTSAPGAPMPVPDMAGPPGSAPDLVLERRDACVRTVANWSKRYRELVSAQVTLNNFFEASRATEIGRDILTALGDLERAIEKASMSTSAADW